MRKKETRMRPVKVLCLEDEPAGYFQLWGVRDGDTVAVIELQADGHVVCVSPESFQFMDVRRRSA